MGEMNCRQLGVAASQCNFNARCGSKGMMVDFGVAKAHRNQLAMIFEVSGWTKHVLVPRTRIERKCLQEL